MNKPLNALLALTLIVLLGACGRVNTTDQSGKTSTIRVGSCTLPKSTTCTLEYSPQTCSVGQFSAEGANRCSAMSSLIQTACQGGMLESEIRAQATCQ